MKIKSFVLLGLAASLTFASCKKEEDEMTSTFTQKFKVTIENVQMPYAYQATGVFNTPVGASEPGGAGPGSAYEFSVFAGENSRLSFATMFVGSNDLFFGTADNGLALYNNGTMVTGDVTSEISLWDAGTEVNEMPGSGSNQPMNQSGPNTGMNENGTVRNITSVMDGFTYPMVSKTIKVTLRAGSMTNEIVVKIENLAGSTTPIAPGVWTIHESENPIFKENTKDMSKGLEALAEDGNPAGIVANNQKESGVNTPFAPGIWAVHESGKMPLFTTGIAGSAELEALAEDGDPSKMGNSLTTKVGVKSSGVFNTPVSASGPAPIFPGEQYEFTFTASKGEYLSLATMYVQSNDLYYSFGQSGIALWNGNSPISGDLTMDIDLWDAGTEVNEYPGLGLYQPVRQSGANTGMVENGIVLKVSDGFMYLMKDQSVKVTISKQ
jgi:hypothetical protein